MPKLDRDDGVRIFYRGSGTGGGTPLLMTHGFGACSRMFEESLEALAAARLSLAWDVRGHGESDAPASASAYSVKLSISDMAAVLDAERIDRVVLLGHSMGGYLSLELTCAHPDRVAGLVLVGTGPGYRSEKSRGRWNQTCESFALSLEKHGLSWLGSASDEMQPEWHRDATGLINAARGILPQHDARVLDHLPSLLAPTLVVVGERDAPFLAGAAYMSEKMPDVRKLILPGAGHAPMISHPAVFNDAVGGFLEEVDSRA